MTIPLSKNARERLDLILKQSNPRLSLSINQMLITSLEPTTLHGRNTRLVVTADHASLSGKRTIYFNRLSLSEAFAEVGSIAFEGTAPTSTHEALGLIRTQAGIALLPEDVADTPIAGSIITLTALSGSLGWIGAATVPLAG